MEKLASKSVKFSEKVTDEQKSSKRNENGADEAAGTEAFMSRVDELIVKKEELQVKLATSNNHCQVPLLVSTSFFSFPAAYRSDFILPKAAPYECNVFF